MIDAKHTSGDGIGKGGIVYESISPVDVFGRKGLGRSGLRAGFRAVDRLKEHTLQARSVGIRLGMRRHFVVGRRIRICDDVFFMQHVADHRVGAADVVMAVNERTGRGGGAGDNGENARDGNCHAGPDAVARLAEVYPMLRCMLCEFTLAHGSSPNRSQIPTRTTRRVLSFPPADGEPMSFRTRSSAWPNPSRPEHRPRKP